MEYISEDFVNVRVKFYFYNYIINELGKTFHYEELRQMQLISPGDTSHSSAKFFLQTVALVQSFFDGAFFNIGYPTGGVVDT